MRRIDSRCVAVIPARGGSKGIRRKNLRYVGGVPLVERAINAARDASHVDGVFVSTDDEEIADMTTDAGATVIMRPSNLAADESSSESALLHALDTLDSVGCRPRVMAFIQCTSPMVTSRDIDGTVKKVISEGADCAFAAAPSHMFLWEGRPSGAVGVNHDPTSRPRRQDMPPQYVEAGSVYAMEVEGFRRARHRFFGRIALHVVDACRAIQIDDPSDLIVAEGLVRFVEGQIALRRIPEKVEAVVLDFDGVLTDDRVTTDGAGLEAVVCSRSDGLGLERLRAERIPILVISKETNPVVTARCAKLQVECIQGVEQKEQTLLRWSAEAGRSLANVVYMGNDVNDVECLRMVGCSVVPSNAHHDVLPYAQIVLNAGGGDGAVRELSDLILSAREMGSIHD